MTTTQAVTSKKQTIALPVRDFGLPCPIKGHIESSSGFAQLYGGPLASAKDGREVHARIQKAKKSANSAYQSEYKIGHKFEGTRFTFNVSGRLDLFLDGMTPTIEEIKTGNNPAKLIEQLKQDRQHPYVLQLLTYAYMVYLDRGVVPRARFIVPTAGGKKHEEIEVPLDVAEYEAWLALRMVALEEEVAAELAHRARRQEMADDVVFPFAESRPGQKELIDDLTEAMQQKAQVLVQAPTGLGKTMGVMLPSLRNALSRGERLIYVTPKNSQHLLASEAVRHLNKNASIKALTLSAKAKMCLKEEVICNPEYCEFARDYYKKMDEGKLAERVYDADPVLTSDVIREYGQEHCVCPFELSLDAVAHADVVIGDYNYVFSPRNTLGRFTYSLSKWHEMPNLVVDEAHNLPQRAQDYYGKRMSAADLTDIARQLALSATSEAIEARALISKLTFRISDIGRMVGFKEAKVNLGKEMFDEIATGLADLMARRLAQAQALDGQASARGADPLLSLANYFNDFIEAVSFEGDEFIHLYTRDKKQDGTVDEALKVVCCDASSKLKLIHKEFANVVAFSATVKPFDYFSQLNGFDPETLIVKEYKSPYPAANRKLLVIPQVSTKYADRAANYGKIAEAICRIIAVKPGNYLVFFPSFVFLKEVLPLVKAKMVPGVEVIRQEPETTAKIAQEVLDRLEQNTHPLVLFAVQGGVFSEGIDYRGHMSIGSIVIGPGLPNFNFEREQMRAYYDKRYGSGFDYAYVYPAMSKVVQAAGRVIRSAEDKGVIVLMDRRFLESTYSAAMPGDWYQSSVQELVSRSIISDITDFWRGHGLLDE